MKASSAQKIPRLLALIPMLHANPGMELKKLQEISGYENISDLKKDISSLVMFGIPPFSPADYMDIYIENERVYVDFPQGLEKPLLLSAGEWQVLQKSIAAELKMSDGNSIPSDIINKAVQKLSGIPFALENETPYSGRKEILEEAMKEDCQIEFHYRSILSREPELRHVDPWLIFFHGGFLYLIGYCHLRKNPRIFHVERMDHLEIVELARENQQPENIKEMISSSYIFNSDSGFEVEIAFESLLLRAVEKYFHVHEIGDYHGHNGCFLGWKTAKCSVGESIWFRSMVRSFGTKMAILSPEHMRKSFLDELNELPEIFPAGEKLDSQ